MTSINNAFKKECPVKNIFLKMPFISVFRKMPSITDV
jgi:hypothetical protein